MPVPKAVQKGLEEAEAREKDLLQQREGTPAEPTPQEGDRGTEPVQPAVDPGPAPEGVGLRVPEGSQPQGSEPSPWEQRFKVLKGKYDKEVPQLHEQLRQNEEAIARLENELKTRDEKLSNLQSSQRKDAVQESLARLENDPDVDEFVKVIKGQDETIRELSAKLENIEQGQQDLNSTQAEMAESAENRFFERLANEVKDINQVNADPLFEAWVNLPDELLHARTGENRTRQQLLDAAVTGLNHFNWEDRLKRVVTIYNDFKRYKAGQGSSGQGQNAHLSPSDSAGQYGNEPAAGQGITWGPQSVKQFYEDARRGRYKGREAEFQKLEQDLNRAAPEGRWDARK